MTTIETKAKALADKPGAIPWALIIQIITAVLGALGQCPVPPTPAKGPGERWWVRRQVRLQLDDPDAYHAWGRQLADDILETGATSTPDEIAAMLKEANP